MKLRHKILLDMQGEYEYTPELAYYPNEFEAITRYLKLLVNTPIEAKNGDLYIKGMRLGKFLNRASIDNNLISKYVEAHKPVKFTLSCRFKDILRASQSKHFSSCYANDGCNSHVPLEFCKDKYIAVCLIRDDAGHIQSRCWLRLCKDSNHNPCIVVYRIYGTGLDTENVSNTIFLKHNIPCFPGRMRGQTFSYEPVKYIGDDEGF